MLPGLKNAEFVKYGVIHRNTYINSTELLEPTYQLKNHPNLFFAGQITGVEGYVESIASGLLAGINSVKQFKKEEKTKSESAEKEKTEAIKAEIAEIKGKL